MIIPSEARMIGEYHFTDTVTVHHYDSLARLSYVATTTDTCPSIFFACGDVGFH